MKSSHLTVASSSSATTSASSSSSSSPLSTFSTQSSMSSCLSTEVIATSTGYYPKHQTLIPVEDTTQPRHPGYFGKSRRSCSSSDHLLTVDSHLNQTPEVVKCTYISELNKDELPRPNFVSSVKSLFERQIMSNAAATSSSSISSSLSPPMSGGNSYHMSDRMATSPNDSFSSSKPSHKAVVNHAETGHSIENLVDRIKHNGTLVYDHTNRKRSIQC